MHDRLPAPMGACPPKDVAVPESTGTLRRLRTAVRRFLFEDDPSSASADDAEPIPQTAVFLARPTWTGTRLEQIETATRFFDDWTASLPRHRGWLESELRRTGGPAVPTTVTGMDQLAAWVHERAGTPQAATPSRVCAVHLVPGEAFGGTPYWQAMMSGLTAVVTGVMESWHPELRLKLKLEPGHVYDLRPAFTLAHITPPWRLVIASANRFRQDGEAHLERLLQATRRPFPEPDESMPADPEPLVQDRAHA